MQKIFAISGTAFIFETIQFVFAIGRADITDVLANALGGIIGIGIYALLSKVFRSSTDQVINVLAAVFTTFALFIVAFLFITHRRVRII